MQKFNKAFALLVTKLVGSMWCAYLFALFDCISLPDAIHTGTAAIISWVAQTFLQLVLLSIIMVGQNVQAEASDARSAKTFEDTEEILNRLDLHTEGGLAEILNAIEELKHGTQAVQVPPGQVPPRFIPSGYKRPPGVTPEAQASGHDQGPLPLGGLTQPP